MTAPSHPDYDLLLAHTRLAFLSGVTAFTALDRHFGSALPEHVVPEGDDLLDGALVAWRDDLIALGHVLKHLDRPTLTPAGLDIALRASSGSAPGRNDASRPAHSGIDGGGGFGFRGATAPTRKGAV